MTGSTISGTVTRAVVLGKHGNYASPLTITATGVVAPTAYGAIGIYAPAGVRNARISNAGHVTGGSAGMSLGGGVGIEFAAAGRLTNTGTVTGGSGGLGASSAQYAGGNGVDLLAGGMIANSGLIGGGAGYARYSNNGDGPGGMGIDALSGAVMNSTAGTIVGGYGGFGTTTAGIGVTLGDGATLVNHGLVAGGRGAYSPFSSSAAGAGVGVVLQDGKIANSGIITGGHGGTNDDGGGGAGGTAVQIDTGSLTNAGTIAGGAGGYGYYGGAAGGAGIRVSSGGSFRNTGVVKGGGGGGGHFPAAAGGVGVALGGGTFTNDGAIAGGDGGGSNDGYGGVGGAGVSLAGAAIFINNGTIAAGNASLDSYRAPQSDGAAGALVGNASFTNAGTIMGGEAAGAYTGGAGVDLTDNASRLTNSGLIVGGAGGAGYGSGFGAGTSGGIGGAGIYLNDGTLTTNTGTIMGGLGGKEAQGGNGVTIGGFSTLTNSGTIIAGLGGPTSGGHAMNGDAVGWDVSGGTLVIDAGAVFDGVVAGDNSSADVVALGAGTGPGTIAGFGTAFTGITNIQVQAGATWDLAGANTLIATSSLTEFGTLTVTGTLTDLGVAIVQQGGILTLGAGGISMIDGVTLHGGALNGAAGGTEIIGTTLASGAGVITIESGAAVAGFGSIGGVPVVDDGMIGSAGSGVILTIETAVTGSGTIAVATGGTVLAAAGVSGVGIDFKTYGTLSLAAPLSVTSTLTGFHTGDVVDLQGLVANTLTYAGGTLTLSKGGAVVDKLYFSGRYTPADFALKSDKMGGTDVVYAGTQVREFGAAVPQDTQISGALHGEPWVGSGVSWHAGEAGLPDWLSAGHWAHGVG